MKKLFLTTLLFVTVISIAQENKQKREELTLEQKVELRVKKMTLDLDLNTKQQEEIKAIFLEEGKSMESRKNEMRENKEQRKELSADERFEMKNKMLDKQAEMKAKMKEILTPEQISKFEKMKEERPMRKHKRDGKMEPKK